MCLTKCLSIVFHWTTARHHSLKYQYAEADVRSQCVWINKAEFWTRSLPKENARIDSTGSNGSPGSVQLYQREKPFSSKTATQVLMNILINSRTLLLLTFIKALKGSEPYSSVTKSL